MAREDHNDLKNLATSKFDDFDFGFSHVSENDLPITQKLSEARDEVVMARQDIAAKLDDVLNEVKQFLDRLKANPDKDMIKWPNRGPAIDKFWEKLKNLAK